MNHARIHCIGFIALTLMLSGGPSLTLAQAPDVAPLSLVNPMVADISQTSVEIQSNFNGTQLLIFGARNMPGELAIVLRGPVANVKLRRKQRIAGMWMHVDQRKYTDLPLFYAIASTKPLKQLASPAVLQSLGLGESRLMLASNAASDDIFDPALIRLLTAKHWWQSPFAPITYFGESLFKARIDLPDTLPHGDYTAEIYLFNRGALLGFQTIPVTVLNTGVDARIANQATHHGAWYGYMAVLMALIGGWLAHRLFHRD